jgi:hypothetical protein
VMCCVVEYACCSGGAGIFRDLQRANTQNDGSIDSAVVVVVVVVAAWMHPNQSKTRLFYFFLPI